MKSPEPSEMTTRERSVVVSVSLGAVLVLALLAYLSEAHGFASQLPGGIAEAWRDGLLRRTIALVIALVFYVAVLPGLLVLAIGAAVEGARGRRSVLTRWVLRESKAE